IAGLGIQFEEMLRESARRLAEGPDANLDRMSLGSVIRFLQQRERLTPEQAELLHELLNLRNLAVHGREISREDALRFFALVERLNDSVSLGYSIDFEPNEDWEDQGLICKYEHCIEHMPLRSDRWEGSCEIFGHDCPGGSDQVNQCRNAGVFAVFRGEAE